MTKLSFQFEGTVAELAHLLQGMHSSTVVRCGTVRPAKVKPESIEDKTWREIAAMVASGQKINAIKAWRERTGVSLKDAKDAVEARGVAAGLYKMGQHGYLTSDRNEWV